MRRPLRLALASLLLPAAALALPAHGEGSFPAGKEPPKDPPKEIVREVIKEVSKDAPKDPPKKESSAELLDGFAATPGLLTVHRKDDKAYASIPKALFDKPLWVSSNLRKGVGSSWIYANSMGPSWIARLRMGPGKTVLLVAQNVRAGSEFAGKDPAYGAMAEADFPESLLASWPIKAADEGAVVVDAASIALTDLGGWAARMESVFKIPYAIDLPNSSISQVANSPTETIFAARLNLASAKVPPGARPPSIPDPRSAYIETALSISLLPESPMKPRAVDERVGLFGIERLDLAPGAKLRARMAFGARWRLEKKDPSAAMSPPVDPIVFHICPAMPQAYVPTVEAGILAWNKAFEALGYLGAVQAVVDKDDAAILAGGRKAVVCFVASEDADAAVGPSKLDPRTGEILEARVLLPEIFMNHYRTAFDERKPASGEPAQPAAQAPSARERFDEMAAYGLGGDSVDWSDKEREEMALGQFQAVVSHEVGHALGLRHNFKASAAYPYSLVSSPSYHGPISASFMDYLPPNVYAGRAPSQGSAFQKEVGAYDMWAIAYAYSSYPDEEAEKRGLRALLEQAKSNPLLAFADDEDAYGDNALDPKAATFDLSAQPLEFAASRIDFAQANVDSLAKSARAGTLSPDKARRVLADMLSVASRAFETTRRYFGGAEFTRQQDESPKPSLAPIDPAEQRLAMAFLSKRVLGSTILSIPPELLARATLPEAARGSSNPSFDFENRIQQIQSAAIKPFFTPGLTDQIMDAQVYFVPGPGKKPPMSLMEVERGVYDAVWRELRTGEPIARTRRNLQRDYVDSICQALKSPANLSSDPRALMRDMAIELRALIAAQAANPKRSPMEKANLRDDLRSLEMALAAGIVRDKP